MKGSNWLKSGAIPDLPAGEVAIWEVNLDPPAEVLSSLERFLSQDEIARADRFYFDYLRRRFVASRGALRVLLGALASESPERVRFDYAKHGKPYLSGSRLRFNVSHAGELALIALSVDREIGVDIEQARDMVDRDAIAKRFFSEKEVDEYLSLDEARRKDAFFRCWTRKEAYIKAIGDGLSYPLDQFVVRVNGPAELLHVYTNPEEVNRWKMANLEPGEGYAGAVIAEGKDWGLQLLSLDLKTFRR